MECLVLLQPEVLLKKPEVGFKIGYGTMIRVLVIDAQTAPYIDHRQGNTLFVEPLLQRGSLHAEIFKRRQIGDLGANVKVHTNQLNLW